VDLTDPFLDGELLSSPDIVSKGLRGTRGTTAGLLFDIVLDSFVGWQAASGKIVGTISRVSHAFHSYLLR